MPHEKAPCVTADQSKTQEAASTNTMEADTSIVPASGYKIKEEITLTKETILTPVHEITFGLDNQLLKLSALNEVFNFVLAGMDKDSVNARKSTAGAVHFTTHYDGYSEMLYLVSSGLLECEATIEELLKRLGQEVRYDE